MSALLVFDRTNSQRGARVFQGQTRSSSDGSVGRPARGFNYFEPQPIESARLAMTDKVLFEGTQDQNKNQEIHYHRPALGTGAGWFPNRVT